MIFIFYKKIKKLLKNSKFYSIIKYIIFNKINSEHNKLGEKRCLFVKK